MSHFIQRYGNPRYVADENKPFAEYFKNNTAVYFLGIAMTVLQWKAHGKYITEEVHRACLSYIVNCAEMSPTYKVMKPHLHFILFEAVFPALCLTPEEVS